MTVLVAVVLALRLTQIRGSLPYSLHYDERHLTERARGIMQTGDWNPHWFRYPSLPIYLTTGAMSAGLLRSAAGGGTTEVAEIGNVATPYYDDPTIVFPARVLFALLGTLSLLLAGGIAWRATGSSVALVVAVGLLAASPISQFHAWAYLNVDTVGTFLALLAVFHALRPRRGGGVAGDGWLAGALAGLAISSKYSLYPILLPGLLRIGLDQDARKGPRAAAFVAAAVLAFAVTTPGLLDLPAFLDGMAFEVHHYARGHGAATIEAGLPHLREQAATIAADLGPIALLLAAVGAVLAIRRDRRQGVLLLVFPAVLLLYLSRQRVHFERNVLSILPFVAVLAGAGLAAVFDLARRARPLRGRPAVAGGVALLLGLAVVATLPWDRIRRRYDPTADSRRLAVEWIAAHVNDDVTLFVAEELEIDLRPLAGRPVVPFSLFDDDVERWRATLDLAGGSAIVYPTLVPSEWRPHVDRIEPIVSFGRSAVKPTVPPPVRGTPNGSLLRPGGSPGLWIGRVE